MFIVNILSSFIMIPFAAFVKAPRTLGLISILLGTPLGFTAALWVGNIFHDTIIQK